MTKKLLSIFVAVMMVLSIVPAAAFASEGTRLSSPATEKSSPATEKSIASWDFETDPAQDGWVFLDQDGDGRNWSWVSEASNSGTHSIMSASYQGGVLHPDNWAISPEFTIPEDGALFNFFTKNYLGSWPEQYSIYVIIGGGDPIEIASNVTVPSANWTEMSYDISAHAGAAAQVAIRHHNVSDMYKFYVDDASIDNIPDPNVIYEADVSGFPHKLYDNAVPGELTSALSIPEGADYSITAAMLTEADGTILASDAELVVGETYVLQARLIPAEGKSFSPEAELTANSGGMETDTVFTGVFDTCDLASIAVAYECMETPAAGFYFETDPAEEGWIYVDADGDGHNWYWLACGINQSTGNFAYEGVGNLTSASYQSAVLHPDNWAISPEFEVPAFEATLSMYIGAQDPSYAAEHYAVYVGTGTDVDSYTAISDEVVVEGTYTKVEFDLSDYAGETISVAVRHFNCSDMFRLNLDQVEVFGSDEEPEDEPIVIDTIEILDFVEPVWGENPFYDVTVPEGANYTIDYTYWNWWDEANDDGDIMLSYEVFDNAGYAYYQYFVIIPDEGYVFADDVVVTINGETAYVANGGYSSSIGYYWLYTIDFYVEEPEQTDILGDVDLDGEVTTADALLALRYVLGLEELSEEQLAQADVNGDGEVAMVDCLLVHRKAMGLIGSFPAEQP